MQFISGFLALLTIVKELVSISFALYKYLRTEYEHGQRVALAKEIREAVKESTESGDNTKLLKLLEGE